jgi:hypothetical protein
MFDAYALDCKLITGDVFFTKVLFRSNVLGTQWLESHLLHW